MRWLGLLDGLRASYLPNLGQQRWLSGNLACPQALLVLLQCYRTAAARSTDLRFDRRSVCSDMVRVSQCLWMLMSAIYGHTTQIGGRIWRVT